MGNLDENLGVDDLDANLGITLCIFFTMTVIVILFRNKMIRRLLLVMMVRVCKIKCDIFSYYYENF